MQPMFLCFLGAMQGHSLFIDVPHKDNADEKGSQTGVKWEMGHLLQAQVSFSWLPALESESPILMLAYREDEPWTSDQKEKVPSFFLNTSPQCDDSCAAPPSNHEK